MKKLLFALTLVLCLAVSLVAFTSCGGGGNDDCEHIWATDATVDTAATCTKEGSKSIKCIECGEINADSVTAIPAYGHSYDDGTTVPATCLEDGSVTKTCAVCGDVKTETIPAAGEHTWSAEAIIDTYPTCTTDGAKSIKCTACQTVKPDTTVVIPAGHTWADAVSVVTPATCTTDGVAAIKCTVCRDVKPETNEVIPATGHTDIDVVVAPTLFSEGRIKGNCSTCGMLVNEAIPTVDPSITEVTVTDEDNRDNVVREYELLGDVLGEGKHFYPTTENPEGRSLFIEFSLLLNDTMNNFVNSNISFPGIYTSTWLDSAYGKSAFWFYIKAADGIAQGGYDDWTSNAVDGADYYNAKPVLAMDGWHRFGFEFHQNTTINGDDVSYTMDVTMYIDGVKVYEATLGKKVEDTKAILLYTAEVVDGEVVYTDRTDAYAAYIRYTTYVTDSENPAYFIFADQHMSCDGFTYEVEPVSNPAAATLEVAEGVTVSAKQYYTYVKSANEKLYDETLDSVEYPVDMITPAEGTVDYSVTSGGTRHHKYLAHDSARVAFVNVKNIAFNTVNIGVADGATVRYTFFSKMPTEFGEVVSYAIQYRTFTTATADVSVEIPANAAYLVLYYQDNATTKYIPESLTFTNDPTTLSEQIKDNTLDTFNYPVDAIKPSQGTIADANLQYIPNFDWVGTFIDIRDIAFEQVTLEVHATTGNLSYTFLTQFPDIKDYVEFAEGCGPVVSYKEQPAGTTYTVDIPEDAVCLYIYWHDEGPIYYIPNSITFTNTDADERTPLDNLQDPVLNEYSYPMDQVLPSEGTIRYNGDHDYHPNEDYKVAFIEITDTVFDLVTLGIDPDIGYVGWTFLTEMPELNEVVSYATGYENHFCWNDNGCDPENVEIPEDANYLVVYYQDSATQPYYPASITFTKAEPETPDEPVDDGTYSYPINTIVPVDAFFNRQGRDNDNKPCTYKVSTSGENVAFIDISELDYNTVTFLGNANKESGWYTFLTKMPTADGEKISYAMNYNKAIWFGLPDGPITVTIPDNAKYIAILYNYENGTPTYPQSIVFSNNENTPSENLKNDTLDSYEYPMEEIKPSMGTIADDGNKFIQNYWWVGSYVGIEDCVFDKVVIEIGESGEFSYAFLTAYPELDKAVSFAGGATATIKVVGDAGTKVAIAIPDDAVCFYIYRHSWDDTNKTPIYFFPASVTFVKCDHADAEYTVTTTPTLFGDGVETATCSCGKVFTKTIAKTEVVDFNTINTTHNNTNTPQATASIGEALGDKTFKPGVDLYLEFSILWNDTMENINGKGLGWGHIANRADVTNEGKSIVKYFSWLYYRPDAEYCPFVGGFEFSEGVKSFEYGPEWKNSKNNQTTEDDFTIIKGLDGWHRIGLQYHQNVYENNGEFTYDVTVTVYVDGVRTNEMILDWGAMFYSAEIVEGETVYTQNEKIDDYYAVFYRIGNGALQDGKTDDAYFPFADCYLTAGDGFVMNVKPVANPEDEDFTVGDVTLSGKMYYEIAEDAEDVVTPNPGDSDDAEDAENAGNGGASDDAENAGNGGASEDAENAGNGGASDDAENAGTTTPLIPGLGTATGN